MLLWKNLLNKSYNLIKGYLLRENDDITRIQMYMLVLNWIAYKLQNALNLLKKMKTFK